MGYYSGRRVLSADGAYLAARLASGIEQRGPAAPVRFGAFESETTSGRKVMAVSERALPFSISGGCPAGDNHLCEVTGECVRFWNVPLDGSAPTERVVSMLRGFDDGALAAGVTGLDIVAAFGQSTAVGRSGLPVLTLTCPRPGYLVMPNVAEPGAVRGPRLLGNAQDVNHSLEPVDVATLRQLSVAHESAEGTSGETALTQMAFEAQKRLGDTRAVGVFNVAIGARTYAQLGPGTAPFANMLDGFKETWLTAKLYGLAVRMAVLYPQNDANWRDDKATFYGHLTELHTSVQAAVAAFTDGDVADVALVFNGFNNAGAGGSGGGSYTEQCLAQLQYAVDFPARAAYATPDYVLPRQADGVHMLNSGYALNGAYAGRALANLWNGHDALPLYATSAAVGDDGVLEIDVHLPYGSSGLSMTASGVTDPGHFGIALKNLADNSAIAIGTLDVQADQIRVTPAAPFGAAENIELSIAFYTTPGTGGGPTSGARSSLQDGSGDVTFYGTPFPNFFAPQRMTVVAP